MRLSTINQIVEAFLALDDYHEPDVELIANEATFYWKTFAICESEGIDKAMEYFLGDHSVDEFQEFRTGVIGGEE